MLASLGAAQISQTSGPTGNLVFQNSTGDTVLNLSETGSINGFFSQGECGSSEAIKTINPDGSYECNSISSTTSAENLSETLAAGNVANQTLNMKNDDIKGTKELSFNSGPRVGDGSSTNIDGDTALGPSASASGRTSLSLDRHALAAGYSANADGNGAVALGQNSEATDSSAVALGWLATSSSPQSTAIGTSSSASADGAVAIGNSANAPNQNEATFGNLNGEELDLNVTGNATIHGSGGLNMPNGVAVGENTSLSGFRTSTAVGSDSVANDGGSTAVGYAAQASSTGTAVGNEASASNAASLALGSGASASGDSGVAIGYNSQATGNSAVAIGYKSVSDGLATARFGSDSLPYDVEVTGDLQVDGSLTGVSTGGAPEGLSETLAAGNVANQTIEFDSSTGVQIGNGSTSTGNDIAVAIGDGSSASFEGDVAIGESASADGEYGAGIGESATAIGENSEASMQSAVAVGEGSSATGLGSIALGGDADGNAVSGDAGASASAEGAVALGPGANAPNQYEATFGNLQGQELDVNVTGNLTVHGDKGLTFGKDGDKSIGFEDEPDQSDPGNKLTIRAQDTPSSDQSGGRLVLEGGDQTGSNQFAGGGGYVTINGGEDHSSSNNHGAISLGFSHTSQVDIYSELDMNGVNITDSDRGNVTVGQDLRVEGDVYSTGADLAEVYSSHQELEKGELVMLSDVKEVERTDGEEADSVGVVSTNPGSVLNYDQEGYPIALEGKVPVKVEGFVEKGERIVPSGTPGVATSCETGSPTEALNSSSSTKEIVKAVKDFEKDQECLKDSVGVAMESGNGKVEVKLE